MLAPRCVTQRVQASVCVCVCVCVCVRRCVCRERADKRRSAYAQVCVLVHGLTSIQMYGLMNSSSSSSSSGCVAINGVLYQGSLNSGKSSSSCSSLPKQVKGSSRIQQFWSVHEMSWHSYGTRLLFFNLLITHLAQAHLRAVDPTWSVEYRWWWFQDLRHNVAKHLSVPHLSRVAWFACRKR